MSKPRNKPDLEGGGLQSLNLLLARRLKRRYVAYAAWLLFLLGAHRFYLQDARHAWLYPAATLLAGSIYVLTGPVPAFAVATGVALFAMRDLWWIDRQLNTVNKRIRMELFLRRDAAPPEGFRGRYGQIRDGRNGGR